MNDVNGLYQRKDKINPDYVCNSKNYKNICNQSHEIQPEQNEKQEQFNSKHMHVLENQKRNCKCDHGEFTY